MSEKDVKVLDGLKNLITGLGDIDQDRDKTLYNEFAAPTTTRGEIESAYRNWLMRKCVDIPVDDAFKKDRYVVLDDPDKAPAFYEMESRFGVKAKFVEAAKLGRLYGGACVVIGTDDPQWELPLKDTAKLTHLIVLTRYDFESVIINSADYMRPNYRLPEFYILKGVKIHHSRVIRFDGDLLPYDMWTANNNWHGSVVERLNDAIKPALSAVQNCSILLEQISVDIFKTPDFMAKLASMGETSAMIQRFAHAAYMRSNLHMMVLDKEEDYIRNSITITGIVDAMIEFLRITAGAADIPATRLLGDAASGLNATGEGDLKNWYDRIAADQSILYAPKYAQIDPLLCRLVWGAVPAGFASRFEPLFQMDDLQIADLELKRSQTDAAYIAAGVLTPAIVARRLQDNETYTIEGEYINALESYKEPEPTNTDPDRDSIA